MVPVNPAANEPGHPGATESPTDAPASKRVWSVEHPPAGIGGNPKEAVAVRYRGTTAASTEIVVADPVSNVTTPEPGSNTLLFRTARSSTPPVASQLPAVAVHMYNGSELTGKPTVPVFATHGDVHDSARLCSSVRTPLVSI
jgi:hypothetical protein